jgi:hypothetical protein
MRATPIGESQLEVTSPPFYVAATAVATMSIAALVGSAIVLRGTPALVLYGTIVIQGLSSLLPLGFLLTGVHALFDPARDSVTVDHRWFGFVFRRSFRFSHVRGAGLESGRRTSRVVILLKDGSIVKLGFLNNAPGQSESVQAINDLVERFSTPE